MEDPKTLILGPAGLRNLGLIEPAAAKAAKVNSGPIVLQQGYPGPRGWGWVHVTGNADRVKQIASRGFPTPLAYACAVASNWKSLRQGEAGKIAVFWPIDGFELGLALTWKAKFWSITTMLPFRSNKQPVLYERM